MNKKRVVLIFLLVILVSIIIVCTFKYSSTFNKETLADETNTEVFPDKLSIKMVGDNLIHNSIYFAAKNETGYNFDMLFENVKEDIQNADISIINQETIFVKDPNRYSSYPTFGSPTQVGDAIYKAGFDVVAHATNHTLDKGISGINDTIEFWENNYPDIKVLGIHKDSSESDITYIEKNNIKLALLNYTYGLNGLSLPNDKKYMIDLLDNDAKMEEDIKVAKENSDMVIVILHVGTEYVYEPTRYHKDKVELSIDSGADIVLCAHPHVLEPYDKITTKNGNTGLVYYSLGNFISNQRKVATMLGGMANIYLERDENGKVIIKDYYLTPLVTHYSGKYYSAYKLEKYTDELAKKHGINKYEGISIDILWELYNKIINK